MASRETDRGFRRFFARRFRPRTAWEGDPTGRPSVLVRSLVFFGIICIVTGVWCCSQASKSYLSGGILLKFTLPGKVLLFNGAMLLALGIVTICASGTMLRLVLISLCQILYVCLVLESIAGAISIALDSTLNGQADFRTSILREIRQKYGREPRLTFTIDSLQIRFNCCGVDRPRDWPGTVWAKELVVGDPKKHLPPSCCGRKASTCLSSEENLKRKVCY
ncbi:hypothetical protein TNIN_410261 [Trichonephila inaurata madagascariensis]|uniref:Tetraspanin n=1 Tax=Trichonephila inaurata madagascariensis TaxID=2747483 RepID=A0A8X6KJX2_9ARAC|nr:hypothetical protein TNIN_410261 [Trichonephila inaurata madagascariensis]